VDFRDIFNQVCSLDPGSSHVVLARRGGKAVLREPCLIALAPRRPPPGRKPAPGHRRAAGQAAGAKAGTGEPFRLQAVGSEVAAPAGGEDNGVRVVHPIDHGRIVDELGLELVLRKVMAQARIHPLRRALFGLRLSLLAPLHLEERERLRFRDLLRDFGFNRIRAVDGPVAAAQGAGLDTGEPRGQMLIDIGGGQATVAAFTLGSIAAWHWAPTGGRALDEAIAAYVLRRHRLHLHPTTAEDIKLRLGSVSPRARPEFLHIVGLDTATGVEKKVTLDDNELRDVLIDACEPLVMAIHQSFDDVPPELAADISQGEITLVGGGALLDGLPRFLAERTGLRFRVAPDPINAAIRGALAAEGEP
jgi:rod shape-determining protein MreB